MAVAEVDRIMADVSELNAKDRLLLIEKMEKTYSTADADNEPDPIHAAFGIWKDYDINKAKLRELAWRKN